MFDPTTVIDMQLDSPIDTAEPRQQLILDPCIVLAADYAYKKQFWCRLVSALIEWTIDQNDKLINVKF